MATSGERGRQPTARQALADAHETSFSVSSSGALFGRLLRTDHLLLFQRASRDPPIAVQVRGEVHDTAEIANGACTIDHRRPFQRSSSDSPEDPQPSAIVARRSGAQVISCVSMAPTAKHATGEAHDAAVSRAPSKLSFGPTRESQVHGCGVGWIDQCAPSQCSTSVL